MFTTIPSRPVQGPTELPPLSSISDNQKSVWILPDTANLPRLKAMSKRKENLTVIFMARPHKLRMRNSQDELEIDVYH